MTKRSWKRRTNRIAGLRVRIENPDKLDVIYKYNPRKIPDDEDEGFPQTTTPYAFKKYIYGDKVRLVVTTHGYLTQKDKINIVKEIRNIDRALRNGVKKNNIE